MVMLQCALWLLRITRSETSILRKPFERNDRLAPKRDALRVPSNFGMPSPLTIRRCHRNRRTNENTGFPEYRTRWSCSSVLHGYSVSRVPKTSDLENRSSGNRLAPKDNALRVPSNFRMPSLLTIRGCHRNHRTDENTGLPEYRTRWSCSSVLYGYSVSRVPKPLARRTSNAIKSPCATARRVNALTSNFRMPSPRRSNGCHRNSRTNDIFGFPIHRTRWSCSSVL